MLIRRVAIALLSTFVIISIALAAADALGWRAGRLSQTAGEAIPPHVAKSGERRFTAYYFHGPHRCPTCRRIEAYAQEALQGPVAEGTLDWTVLDYSQDENQSLAREFKVLAPTVILAEWSGGTLTRWRDLEEVWNHTDDKSTFLAYVGREWRQFQEGH